jgi:hypothetical protein
MAKLTTLEYAQRALSAINSENISSISDGVEADQVLKLLNSCYEQLLDDYPWTHLRSYGQLEVTATAHIMKIPNTVKNIDGDLIRYNKNNVWYVTPDFMIELLDGRDTTASNVDSNGAVNDSDPQYWTTQDDENIIFDSYDGSLVASLTNVWMITEPTKLENDTDVPDLPDMLHGVLLNSLLENCFRTLKGDEQAAQIYFRKYISGLSKAKRWARKQNKLESTNGVDYGRKATLSGRWITDKCYREGA